MKKSETVLSSAEETGQAERSGFGKQAKRQVKEEKVGKKQNRGAYAPLKRNASDLPAEETVSPLKDRKERSVYSTAEDVFPSEDRKDKRNAHFGKKHNAPLQDGSSSGHTGNLRRRVKNTLRLLMLLAVLILMAAEERGNQRISDAAMSVLSYADLFLRRISV